jgi:hypothetical protein
VQAQQVLQQGTPGPDAAQRLIEDTKDTLAQFLDDQVMLVDLRTLLEAVKLNMCYFDSTRLHRHRCLRSSSANWQHIGKAASSMTWIVFVFFDHQH